MPVPTDITAGTLTITNGSTAVTGSGTSWLASDLRQGDVILWIEGGDGFQTPILASVPASNTALTLVEPWAGPTLTGARYRIRYQWDSSRVSAQSRQLIEILDNGNVLAFTGLTGPGVPVFDGPHSITIKPESDFVSGVTVNARVETLAGRSAYDGQTAGFSVYVNDIGDGRAAVYFKKTNSLADWSTPAYQTGPQGSASTVPGVVWRGTYSAGTLYAINDGVTFNGSSFRKLTTAAAGNAPSSASPPVNNTNWEVLAAKGLNGTGTGDVVGPATSTSDNIAVFDGSTGKLIKDSGKTLAQFDSLSLSVSILSLQVADNSNSALFMGNSVADSFRTLAYVDVAGATNLDTSVIGVLKGTSTTTDERSGTGTVSAAAGWTYVNRSFDVNNSSVVDGIYIWSDTAYSGTARILLRNSSSSYTFLSGSSVSFSHSGGSAWQFFPLGAPLAIPASGSYYASIFGVGASPTPRGFQSSVARSYYNGDVTGTQASGWTEEAASSAPSIGVRYMTGVGNLTVRSAAFTALSVPSSMSGVIKVKEIDAATAGTDYTLECSRDNGTSWSVMTLTEIFTSPSPTPDIRVVQAGATSVGGQPSGTVPRWRFKTLNSKNIELHDVQITWG